jgi:hypothetical protein
MAFLRESLQHNCYYPRRFSLTKLGGKPVAVGMTDEISALAWPSPVGFVLEMSEPWVI